MYRCLSKSRETLPTQKSVMGTLRLLEAIRILELKKDALTGVDIELYGKVQETLQRETIVFLSTLTLRRCRKYAPTG